MYKLLVVAICVISFFEVKCELDIDINGYIAYCPCMGRFGNQADHFLGVLGFAKALNRTLILPPWVEYRTGEVRSIQVPFDAYFNVMELAKCHKVIIMEDFMKNLAPTIWPPQDRKSLCYTARGTSESCNAKEGNPFGPFWDTYDINFTDSSFYKPLHFDVYHSDVKKLWLEKYPAISWPVLAFTGAPASFPVQMENKHLQKCLSWNDEMTKKAKSFIKTTLPPGAFIGIHLRNGIDWVRACEYISTTPNLFAAAQCLGYRNERGKATSAMCLPSIDVVLRQIKRVIRNGKNVKSVFVASDSDHMMGQLTEALARMQVSVHRLQDHTTTPHLDLAILARANYFIGNCISSFTAFVARERQVKGLPTLFWAFPPSEKSPVHEEL